MSKTLPSPAHADHVLPAARGGARVEVDRSANRFAAIYLGAWVIIAGVLCTLTYALDWGYYGWFGGVFALAVGGMGLAGMLKTGGAGVYACPCCGERNEILHISMRRVEQCSKCSTWLEGAEMMTVVPDDRVVDEKDGHPFLAPLRPGATLPQVCPLCAAPASRQVIVEGAPRALGAMVAAQAVGVGVYKSYKIAVPACHLHDEPGVAIESIQDVEGQAPIGLAFRSMAYYRRFCAANEIDPTRSFRGAA